MLIAAISVTMLYMSIGIRATATSDAAAKKFDVTHQAALAVRVQPPSSNTPRIIKRIFWKLENFFLRVMSWCDPCSPPDSKLSLRVLWWKAVAANDVSSPAYDRFHLINDLLPFGVQWLVKWPLNTFYPRWTHVIVEIRTAYLDQVIGRIRNKVQPADTRIRLVSMGGGYDVRSLKLVLNGMVNDAVELDLPQVIQAKQRLLQRLAKRQRHRRRDNKDLRMPTFYQINLTDVPLVQSAIVDILNNNPTKQACFTVFLFEGVLMYLPQDIPSQLFRAIRQSLVSTQQVGCIIFADDLQFIPNDNVDTARQKLTRLGWNVTEWLPKGGRTQHMGCVEMLPSLG